MEKTNRIYKYDNLKFFLIICVVVGHMIDYFGTYAQYPVYVAARTFIYSFHMPVFIFLSGLFYKRKDTAIKVFRFFAIGLLMLTVNHFAYRLMHRPATLDILHVGGVAWYMYAMGFFNLLMYFTKNINKRLLLVISLLAALCIGYTSFLGDFLSLTRVIVFFPVYLLGTMVDRRALCSITERKVLKFFSAATVILCAATVYLRPKTVKRILPLLSGKNAYKALGALAENGAYLRLLCFAIAVILGFALLCLAPNFKIPVITQFGARTLQVYFWHTPIVYLLITTGITQTLSATAGGKAVYLLIGIILVFLLSLKPFAFPTKQIIQYAKKPES